MEKDAYYFPHFCNARHDRKILRLRADLKIEGYAVYFMLLEVLREQDNFKYPIADIDLLSTEFGSTEAIVKAVVMRYNLFEIDQESNFFSLKFIEYMQPYLNSKEQRRLAGKKSAEKRKQLQRPFNDRSTAVQQSKVNESKEKEIKVNEIKVNESTAPAQNYDFDFVILEAQIAGLSKSQAESMYHHYNSQGWYKSNGQPVTDIKSAAINWLNKESNKRGKETLNQQQEETYEQREQRIKRDARAIEKMFS